MNRPRRSFSPSVSGLEPRLPLDGSVSTASGDAPIDINPYPVGVGQQGPVLNPQQPPGYFVNPLWPPKPTPPEATIRTGPPQPTIPWDSEGPSDVDPILDIGFDPGDMPV